MKKSLLLIIVCAAALGLLGFEPADVVEDDCSKVGYMKADCESTKGPGAGTAKNVILLIGDGMGINQVFAARTYLNGPDSKFSWESLPHQGLVTTCVIGKITDSAASATALGAGHKTNNGVVGHGPAPGYEKIPNVLDLVHHQKAVGIVTTTTVWDATPAGFTAHAKNRGMDRAIARQYVNESRPEVIMGGGGKAFDPVKSAFATSEEQKAGLIEKARQTGYEVVRTRKELKALDPGNTERVLGLFAPDKMQYEINRAKNATEPHLSEMTAVALKVLERDPRGFFLMIEGARIDHSNHRVDVTKLIGEMVEFNLSIEMVLEWAEDHPDTLVIVTADHECGGVSVKPDDYQKGDKVKVKWDEKITPFYAGHSNQRVPIYAVGPGAGAVRESMDNTEVFCVIKNAFDLDD